jgi:hypothetical protein
MYGGYHFDEPSVGEEITERMTGEGRATVFDSMSGPVPLESDADGDCVLFDIPRDEGRESKSQAVWAAFYQPLVPVLEARTFVRTTADGLTEDSQREFVLEQEGRIQAKIVITPGTDVAVARRVLHKIANASNW